MELWIRSQDKTKLMKVDEVEFQQDDYGFCIFAWKDKFEGSRTGTYKSKERALEVLDEIQNKIKHINKFALVNEDYECDDCIYEMPIE